MIGAAQQVALGFMCVRAMLDVARGLATMRAV